MIHIYCFETTYAHPLHRSSAWQVRPTSSCYRKPACLSTNSSSFPIFIPQKLFAVDVQLDIVVLYLFTLYQYTEVLLALTCISQSGRQIAMRDLANIIRIRFDCIAAITTDRSQEIWCRSASVPMNSACATPPLLTATGLRNKKQCDTFITWNLFPMKWALWQDWCATTCTQFVKIQRQPVTVEHETN